MGRPDLSVEIGQLKLATPLIAASGCFGYGVEYSEVVDLSKLGGVAVKGLFLEPREGHAPPRIVETPSGMLNAIGLQGIGVHRFVNEKSLEATRRYMDIAKEAGMSPVTLATAWSKQHDFVASTIVGVSKFDQLADILAAADLELSSDVMKACDAVGHDVMYPMG